MTLHIHSEHLRRGLSTTKKLNKSGGVEGEHLAYAQDFFSIPELALRWRCSRGTVYNLIRGEKVLDFASPGHRGKKLVPATVVARIEEANLKVFR
jgi:hypothetical protein